MEPIETTAVLLAVAYLLLARDSAAMTTRASPWRWSGQRVMASMGCPLPSAVAGRQAHQP